MVVVRKKKVQINNQWAQLLLKAQEVRGNRTAMGGSIADFLKRH